jgi:asparagine synthase (glutamine-hydrolysing)
MCGICGIYTFDRGRGIDGRELVVAMNGRMIHRGPDEEGFHVSGPIALGHRRLSIIDVANGKQPMSNKDGTVWIVFNGEIYNHNEWRAALVAKGHQFATRSDTEVIVHLYEEFGEKFITRLNGMFAIALWDMRREKLILARDRIGKKPLYYHANGQRLAFASELKALLRLSDVPLRINPDSIDHYLSFLCSPASETIISGVSKLEPATYLVCEKGKIRKERYWRIDFGRRYRGARGQAVAELADLLQDAVKIRLESEVPLGAFLSGGVDSSLVVALMARLAGNRVKTTSIGFAESAFNELDYARVVAAHLQTDHREHILTPNYIECLPRIVDFLDEPFADSSALPTYLLCQATRQHVTVALSGDGGDENFAGYERYAWALKEEQWRRMVPAFWRKLALASGRLLLTPYWRGYTLIENLNQDLLSAAARTLFCFQDDMKRGLYSEQFRRQLKGPSATECFLAAAPKNGHLPSLSRLQSADLACYLPDDILTKLDRMSMAHSLEVRAPLLDYRVVELGESFPPEWKLDRQGSKLILKDAVRGLLPPETLNRRKAGFGIPLGQWFRKEWAPLVEEIILGDRALGRGYFDPAGIRKVWHLHRQGKAWHLDLGEHLWTLLVLELWHRLYVDGETVECLQDELSRATA